MKSPTSVLSSWCRAGSLQRAVAPARELRLVCLSYLVLATAALQLMAEPIEDLTLGQAIASAEQMHPDIAEAQALAQAAEDQARQAGTLPNPELIGRIEAAPLRGNTLGQADYFAGVAQTIPLGRRLSQARRVEILERNRWLASTKARAVELRRAVHSAFATALYQEQAARTQSELQAGAERTVAITRAQVNAGDVTPDELARAELESARVRQEWRRSLAMREQALASLAATIGQPGIEIRSLSGNLETVIELPTIESIARNLAEHPAIAVAQADLAAHSARVDLAEARRIPDIRVEALYRRMESSRQDAFDLGISMPFPLFDRNQGRLRAARAELDAAEARSRSAAISVEGRFRESYARLRVALLDVETLRTEVVPRAETVLRAYEARFAAGAIALSELLPVRREWAAIQLDYLETLRDTLEAWGDLHASFAEF